jgi:ribonuclease VapC
MILDSSAIVAIVLREPGWEALLQRLADADTVAVGAPTLAEAGIVLSVRLGRDSRGLLQGLLRECDATTVPFGEEHWREALDAFARFGRGRHRARLNFGDCLAYAVAKLAGQPLLCLGDDFGRTDISLA